MNAFFYRLCIPIVCMLALSSCEKKEPDFPGFSPVNIEGEDVIYLYDPKSITDADASVGKDFLFIKKLSDGYILQKGYTDCKSSLITDDGSFYAYKDKGKAQPFKGSILSDIKKDIHITALIKEICKGKEEPVASNEKGDMDTEIIKEFYLDTIKQKSLPRDQVTVELLSNHETSLKGNDYRVSIFSINHKGNDCHACTGKNGIFVWRLGLPNEWKLIQQNLDLAAGSSQGGFGNPPEIEWIKNKNGDELLAIYSSYMAQGYISNSVEPYLLTETGVFPVVNPQNLLVESRNIETYKIVQGDSDSSFKLLTKYEENGVTVDKYFLIDVKDGEASFIKQEDSSQNSSSEPLSKNQIIPMPNKNGFMLSSIKASRSPDENNAKVDNITSGSEVIVTGISVDKNYYEIKTKGKKYNLYVPVSSVAILE